MRRFIEVKGRSNSTAKIDLKGNELTAASKYRDRYYLYRFYEQDAGDFVVSILKNPVEAEEAVEPVIEVDLEVATTTERFGFVLEEENEPQKRQAVAK